MRLLADTHALLWWLADESPLSVNARVALSSPDNEVYVSAVTAWEIAIKSRRGKLQYPQQDVARLGETIAADGFRPLPLALPHALRAGGYPQPHGDPFDRMLAAQCEIEGLVLVTRDPAFAAFPCSTLW